MRKQASERALLLARQLGIAAASHPLNRKDFRGLNAFDKAGFPLPDVTASNGTLSNNDGALQCHRSQHFPDGVTRHHTDLDKLSSPDRWQPGQIALRAQDSIRVLLPPIGEVTHPNVG